MHIGLVDLNWKGHHTPYVVYLSRYFTERGHEVTFITDEENPRLDELPDAANLDIRTEAFPRCDVNANCGLIASVNEQRIRVGQLRKIFEMTTRAGADVVHLLYFDRTQVPLWITRKLSQERMPSIVATLHRDAFTNREVATGSKRATRWVTKRALDSCLADGTLDCLTVHAESIRRRIVDTTSEATEENTRVIPAPTPELSVDVSSTEARERLDLPQDEPLFLFFGGLREEKGPDLLAEALRNVERELTVVFAGPEGDFTQDDVNEWKRYIPTNVNIVDRIDFVLEGNVDYYFIAADALLLPYRRTRGISGPLRRAAMAGTPIVARRDTDIGNIVKRCNLGVVVGSPVTTQLCEFFDQFTYSTTLACDEALLRFATSHHWTATGDALLDIYKYETKYSSV